MSVAQVSELDGLVDDGDAAEKAREKVAGSANIQYFVYNDNTLISCVQLGGDRYGCLVHAVADKSHL